MRIHVDLPFNKPLCRGGNIVNLDGSKTWVTFKYEGLPCFCFQCGLLGHDDRHCGSFPYNPDSSKQYGDWLKVGANSKGGSQAAKNPVRSDRIRLTDTIAQLLSLPCDQPHVDVSDKGSRDVSALVGLPSSSTQEAQEVTSPLKPIKKNENLPEKADILLSPTKRTQPKEKNNWKRIACGKGKQAQPTPTRAQVNILGIKSPIWLDFSEEIKGNSPAQKRLCKTQHNTSNLIPDGSAVSARQHRRPQ
nr:hypothetical protein CFP56_07087 [Quercus suber]